MAEAKLNQGMLSTAAGYIRVYNFDGETYEYLSFSDEYLLPGVGIPANSCTDSPGEGRQDYVICRTADLSAWEYRADHRGETVYSLETGRAIKISTPGDYPAGTTTQAPSTPFDRWHNNQWVTDAQAQHAAETDAAEQQKSVLLAQAQETISLWQTELQLGEIGESDKDCLKSWVSYIKQLQAIATSTAPDITWPNPPRC